LQGSVVLMDAISHNEIQWENVSYIDIPSILRGAQESVHLLWPFLGMFLPSPTFLECNMILMVGLKRGTNSIHGFLD